jgi:hypothetical protein
VTAALAVALGTVVMMVPQLRGLAVFGIIFAVSGFRTEADHDLAVKNGISNIKAAKEF